MPLGMQRRDVIWNTLTDNGDNDIMLYTRVNEMGRWNQAELVRVDVDAAGGPLFVIRNNFEDHGTYAIPGHRISDMVMLPARLQPANLPGTQIDIAINQSMSISGRLGEWIFQGSVHTARTEQWHFTQGHHHIVLRGAERLRATVREV